MITGDVVAARLRKAFGFVPMVFYSGNLGGVADLREKLIASNVDGVHCVARRDLVDFLAEQLDELLHPLSRIEVVRGSAVGALAECDEKLRHWFLTRSGELDGEAKIEIENKLNSNLAESNRKRDKQWELKDGDLRWKVDRTESYQFMRIARNLAQSLGEGGLPEQGAFNEDLIKPRNILGHAVAERTANGLVVRSSHGGEIKPEELADLRRRMAEMKDAILRFAVLQEPK